MAKKVKTKKTNIIKKGWVKVFAPKLFKEQEIGESYVADPNNLIGRKLTINLMTLTKDPKKQGINVVFEIVSKKASGMATEFVGHIMVTSSVKRMIRRGKNKVDDSFTAVSKDNIKVRVKPLFQTKNHTPKSLQSNIRLSGRKMIVDFLKENNYEDFCKALFNNSLRKTLFDSLKKIYPLQTCEIREVKALHKFSK